VPVARATTLKEAEVVAEGGEAVTIIKGNVMDISKVEVILEI